MLNVYKASAGSGKTFQLVVEYLKLILDNPFNYRHILAVTFTNKATNEMKSRILEQLHLLAENAPSDYLEVLMKETGYPEKRIREQAGRVLKNILHDYNRFSISTIDSFTQKVIKAFNRELGISPNFTLELDNKMILAEAVDGMLARIGEDKKLRKWLKDFSREKIEENRSRRIDDDIKGLGSELVKERFQVFFPQDGESEYTKENLESFGDDLRKLKGGFESDLKKQGEQAVSIMDAAGFTPADFKGGARSSVGTFFVKLSNGLLPNFTKTVRESAEDPEKWAAQKHPKREEIVQLAETQLRPILVKIVDYYDRNLPRYNTALAVLKQLRTLGILTDLKDEINKLTREKGILQLSDSNLLLSKIIGNSESPFVYEKIGNVYRHFMLDEFQDTSGLQWHNFKPLVANALAEGNANLIVGDVKQSIYRWRNSDWNILSEQLDRDFNPNQKKDFTLKYNWRSDKNIIDFNNQVIKNLKDKFEEILFGALPDNKDYIQKFNHIYGSFAQEQGKKGAEKTGYIRATFLPKEDFEAVSTEMLVGQVKQLQDKGIRADEIAILVRKNKEGTQIIEKFLEAAKQEENRDYNLSVLSNESLFLHASKGVLFVIAVLEHLVDPGNKITKATLLQLWFTWLKPEFQKRRITIGNKNGQGQMDFTDYFGWHLESDYEETFQNELSGKLDEAREKVLLSSLDETITRICSQFGLFNFESELPFLQTLIDKAGELKASLSNDLSNLLFWWHEKGFSTSVNVNEEVNSIRLMTVHKAKGLEFKAVLIPYFNWETHHEINPILWCSSDETPFDRFPLLPVTFAKSLTDSLFKEQYLTEAVSNYIDTLNLIYVAFTRAKSVLMINCMEATEPSKNSSPERPVNYLLHKALLKQAEGKPFTGCWHDDQRVFEYGSIPGGSAKAPEEGSIALKDYHFKDFGEKIRLRLSGEDFLVAGEKQHSVKNTGKLVHEILSAIETRDDVDNACTRAHLEGKISQNELDEIKAIIKNNLGLPEVQAWFDGSHRVLNERNLLTNERLLRPDRIMISGDRAIVVDYKTGEKNPQKYNRQVERYARLLKETGFGQVEGYLWYIGENEVEKVCTL